MGKKEGRKEMFYSTTHSSHITVITHARTHTHTLYIYIIRIFFFDQPIFDLPDNV